VAALTPLSVDGMIVAASTTLLADSRSGVRGQLPAASLAQCVPSLSVIWRGPSWLHGHLAGTKPLGAGSLPLHIVVEPDESRRMTQKEAASIAVAGVGREKMRWRNRNAWMVATTPIASMTK
jgi:hypothetical protein